MDEYNGWKIYNNLPPGWVIDNTCGSPLSRCVFISDGKSILRGGARALLRIKKPPILIESRGKIQKELNLIVFHEDEEKPYPARTVNELARESFKLRLLNDIRCDLMICEIEGWEKLEYIKEMQALLNSIGSSVLIDSNKTE